MSDFITADVALAFLNSADLNNLKGLDAVIAKPQYFEYFGMHLSEGIVYLTYYYKVQNRSIHYKFDITVAGSNYHIVLKRVNNHAMNANDFAACSAILSQFPKAQTAFSAGNLIDLGIYSHADTVKNMQSALIP